LRRRALVAALALAVVAGGVVAGVIIASGGPGPSRPPSGTTPPPLRTPSGPSLAIGITETNPALLWSAASGVDVGPFAPWRDRLAAIRPRYVHVLVDWNAVQPDQGSPPNFDAPADGCARTVPPCRQTGGLRELLRAIRSQQQAQGGFEIDLVIYGTPAWAARPPSGCERAGTDPWSRPVSEAGLRGYRTLVRGLVALGRQERVPLRWWSPWNEPNAPLFMSPQRSVCDPLAPPQSPAQYAVLWRAMRDELRAAGGQRGMLLGALADARPGRFISTTARDFLAGLPRDVLCDGDVISLHKYAGRGAYERRPDVVAGVEALVDDRCGGDRRPIWITETGAGGHRPGLSHSATAAGARADCRAQQRDLRRWWADPRVTAAFQYTFRDDPDYPVGLADAGLTSAWPTLDLLTAWGDRAPSDPPPPLPAACGE
jgi:hypothetical protein